MATVCDSLNPIYKPATEFILQELLEKTFKEGFEEGRLGGFKEGIKASIDVLQSLLISRNPVDPETSIEDLGLPIWIENGLRRDCIDTVEELKSRTPQSLKRIRGIGDKGVENIANTMAKIGHPLATE